MSPRSRRPAHERPADVPRPENPLVPAQERRQAFGEGANAEGDDPERPPRQVERPRLAPPVPVKDYRERDRQQRGEQRDVMDELGHRLVSVWTCERLDVWRIG